MALGNLTVRLGLDAADYIAGLTKAEAEAAKFAKQQERTALTIDKQVKALESQAATLGLSERQLKIVELAQRGATKAQLESANAALKQKEAFQEANKAIANAAAKAKATTDATAAIDKQVKALHDQVAVQGRSERQTKLYALEQAGATKAQLASADAALKQKAAYEATTKFMRDLGRAALVVGAALGAAAIAGAVLFEKFVGKAASFQDLAEKTGASAEALASFQSAATVTNTSMDTLANLSVKLTKGLAGTDEETKQAANAIAQLGLNVNDFKKLDPGAQFELIAKTLNKFEDGAGKTAFAVAAMGRAGADSLPFFKELAAQGQRNITLTAAQIKAADDYKDAQARLRAEIELFGQKLAIAAIGPLGDFKTALIETAKQVFGFGEKVTDLGTNTGIQDFVDKAARALAVLINALDLVTRGFQLTGIAIAGAAAQAEGVAEGRAKNLTSLLGPLQFIKNVIRGINQEAKEVIDRPLFTSNLEAARAARAAQDNAFESNFPPSSKPRLRAPDFGGGGRSGSNDAANKAAAEAKKLLDKQLSDIDNFIKAEKRMFDARESDLARLYQNDQISISAYFDKRLASLEQNTTATIDQFNKQIAAQEAFAAAAKRRKDEPAFIDAQKNIGRIQSEIEDALHEKRQRALKLEDDRISAARAYADQVDELRAKVLELSNTESDAAKAALIRFDNQTRALRQRSEAQSRSPLDDERNRGAQALKDIGVLRQREDAQTRINQLLQEAQIIEEHLGTTEARLNLERNLGLRGELASLGELGKARAASLPDLQRIADRYREIAAVSGDERLIAAADRFNLKIQELAATTDVLADKFHNLFEDSFADAFASFIDGTISAKDAFKAFADDVVRQINRMAAQEIASAVFGKGSGGQGGGWLSSLIGLIAGAFGGGGSTAASNFGMNVREKGGPVSGRTPYIVGERGPEIFVPKIDGIVIPNDKVNKLSKVLQGRANGGPVVSATPYIVGERGPEIFTPRTAAILGSHETVVTRLVSIVQPKASQVASGGLKTNDERAGKLIQNKKSGASYPTTSPAWSAFAVAGLVPLTTPVVGLRDAQSSRLVPRVVGARGPELFVSKAAGISIPNDKVAKLAGAFERKAASVASGAPVTRRREISAPLAAARTIMRDEKIITRYANAPYSRPAAAHVQIPKPVNAAVQRDEAINKLSTAFQKQGRGSSASVASRSSAASAAIDSRQSGGSATKTSRIIPERAPQIYIPQSANAILQSKRAVAELVSNAPRQRREDGGPVAASTPYVVGELGPELFMPKSAERIIKHEKTIDDLVSNKIQHRDEIFISKLASKNIKNEKFINDLVSNDVQHRASVKNERVQNDLVSNTRNEKTINQLVSNIQREPFAAHQTYLTPELRNVRGSHYGLFPALELGLTSAHMPLRALNFTRLAALAINEREIPKSARKVIKSDDIVSSVQRRIIAATRTPYVREPRAEAKAASRIIKNEKAIDALISNTTQRKNISLLQTTNDLTKTINKEVNINKAINNNAAINNRAINNSAISNQAIRNQAIRNKAINNNSAINNKSVNNKGTIDRLISNIERTTNNVERTTSQSKLLVTNAGSIGTALNNIINVHGGTSALNKIINIHDGVALLAMPAEKIVNNNRKISELISKQQQNDKTVINNLKNVEKTTAELWRPIVDSASTIAVPTEKIINNSKISKLISDQQTAETVIKNLKSVEKTTELLRPTTSKIVKNELSEFVSNIQNNQTTNEAVQRRANGGPVAAHQTYLASKIKNEKVIYDLVTNTIQHKAQGGPVEARQTYIVGEHGSDLFVTSSAEKIIKNENKVSELVTNNSRRNEKVINDLVSKTVHHRERSVVAPQLSIPFNLPHSGLASSSPDVAAKIIKNESRISELVSNDVQRNEEIINRLATNTHRESGRSNQLLIVGAHGPELFIPKAAGSIIKNDQRINELVSNIEHRNIDRRSQKTIDEIISSTVQRRAQGGPVETHQKYLVGERGPELYVPRDIKVPSDFFTNEQYRLAGGGAAVANQPYIVGERGPEWFVPKTSGTIISNGKTGGMTVQNTFVLPPGPFTRDTQTQIAASAARSVAIANRRVN